MTHPNLPLRMAMILVVAGFAEAMVPVFLRHPFPWVVVVPGLIPVLTAILVIRPLIRADALGAGPRQPMA